MYNASIINILKRWCSTPPHTCDWRNLTQEQVLNAIGDWLTITLPTCITVDAKEAEKTDATLTGAGLPDDPYILTLYLVRGKDGDTPTVTVNKTETLEAGSEATVENVGTDLDVKLNFGIPRGETPTIEVNKTETLTAGSEATVENVGTDIAVKLDFGIPRGADGSDGISVVGVELVEDED